MKSLSLTPMNLAEVQQILAEESLKKPLLIVRVEDGSIGKWEMSRLWRSWMASTAEYMAGNGCVMPLAVKPGGEWYGERPFNKDDAHELFTRSWLGVDKEGKRLSWAKQPPPGERLANKGERFQAMLKHQTYMVERGIKHMIPRDSEFFNLLEETNGG